VVGFLVGVVNACEPFDLAAAGLGEETLHVPLLAHIQRCIHKDLDVMIIPDCVAHIGRYELRSNKIHDIVSRVALRVNRVDHASRV